MKLFAKDSPWYIAGLAFDCQQCGGCCAGPQEGYVWVTEKEIRRIADHLDMTVKDFRRQYVRRVGSRRSRVEKKPSNDCIFLTEREDGEGQGCSIYEVRPQQCRTWPFWPSNIEEPTSWALAGARCPGINRGELVNVEEIETRARTTREH